MIENLVHCKKEFLGLPQDIVLIDNKKTQVSKGDFRLLFDRFHIKIPFDILTIL